MPFLERHRERQPADGARESVKRVSELLSAYLHSAIFPITTQHAIRRAVKLW
jgi:hypothetical protein